MGMYREALRKKFREVGDMMRKEQPKYLSGVKKQAQEQSDHKQTMDMVNHPPHYNQAGIEALDAILAATNEGSEYYLQGNIIKYLWRYRYKNGIEDIDKAIFYLNKLRKVLKDASKSNDDFKS